LFHVELAGAAFRGIFHAGTDAERQTEPAAPGIDILCVKDAMNPELSEQDQAELRLEFARLKQEHADLDAAINAMIATGCDPLQIQRLKKKKLQLKDRLQATEDRIIPDIIA